MSARSFGDWELSQQTQRGLQQSGFKVPTLIQKLSIGPALDGSDIVGAAKTGSGKTLAYIIPLLEKLRSASCNREYGVGALVLTPTRELAAQIFFVLKNVGRFHPFSAGAAFGGSTQAALKMERKTVGRAQILIATPGRLLDHLESGSVSLDNLQLLVVDEADKLLEMGFQEQLDRLSAYLPSERQTLLFSATQSRSTKELSRLILKPKPVFVQTEVLSNNLDHFVLPERLRQFYVVCPLDEKLNVLWSFTQKKGEQKCIVFLDTCKQVRFVYEAFRQLRSRVTVVQLHGKMKQHNRLEAFNQFRRKQSVVLFATDVAARGLDFPDVNWVLQVDAPRDARTYVHRVGRTARYQKNGQAVTLVMPQEAESFVQHLEERGISVSQIKVRPDNMFNVTTKLNRLVSSQRNDLQGMAERAFVAYLREQCLFRSQSDASYKPWELDIEAFSLSYGLMVRPKLSKKLMKILNRSVAPNSQEIETPQSEKAKKSKTCDVLCDEAERMFCLNLDFNQNENFGSDDSDAEDLMLDAVGDELTSEPSKATNKLEAGKKALRSARSKGVALHDKITFSDSEEEGDDTKNSKAEAALVLSQRPSFELLAKSLLAVDKRNRKAFLSIAKGRKREEKQKRKRQLQEVETLKDKKRRRRLGIPDEGPESEDDEVDAPRLGTGNGSSGESDASGSERANNSDSDENADSAISGGSDDSDEENDANSLSPKDANSESESDTRAGEIPNKSKRRTQSKKKTLKKLHLDDLEKLALDLT